MKKLLAAVVCLLLTLSWANAQSTINPNVPAQNAPLNSGPVRSNFANAFSDINGLLGMHPVSTLGACTATPLVGTDCLVQTSPTLYSWYKYMGPTGYAFIGTFNPSLPLFNNLPSVNNGVLIANCSGTSPAQAGGCTWNSYANQAIGNTNGMLPYRTGGTWGTISTGTSGGTIPLNNTANVFSAPQVISLNSGALQAPLTGTLHQLGNANGTISRLEMDSYAAVSAFTGVRADNTAASPAAIQNNDELVSLNAWGYNGTAFVGGVARVSVFAAQNWSVGAQGSYLRFSTTANGTNTLTDQVGIENDGGVTVPPTVTGGSKGAGTLNAGGLYVNGVAVSAGSVVSAGTVNQLAWYAASGTTLSGLATANNGVLVTSGTGAPSISSTLPSGIAATNMALTTPALGIATATSLATGGCTIGAFSFCVLGSSFFQTAGTNGLAVGLNGAVNPAFNVDASTALQVAGLNVKGAVTGGTVAVSVIDSGSNANLTLNAKGTGTIGIGTVSSGTLTLGGGGGSIAIGAPVTGNFTLSGNVTHSGQLIATGTSAPASAAGNTVIMGTIAAPTLANNGQAFFYNTTVNGAVHQGQGSTYDAVLENNAGAVALGVLTGTTTVSFPGGLTATGLSVGTCVNGLAINSSNQMIKMACTGSAASIAPLTTTISPSTPGSFLWNNAGTLDQGKLNNALTGLVLSNDGTTPNSVLDVALGSAMDSTNATLISIGAFTKSTAGAWAAGSGSNGMGNGLAIAASTWYHVCLTPNGGTSDIWFDTSATCANKPAGVSGTLFRRIGAFRTDASSHILAFVQHNDTVIWSAAILELSTTTPATSLTLLSLSGAPQSVSCTALLRGIANATAAGVGVLVASGDETSVLNAVTGNRTVVVDVTNIANAYQTIAVTNNANQIKYQADVSTWNVFSIVTFGYMDTRGK